ncbi:Binding-protein-dependent transport systems inner membrane component [Sulfitobacter noctilucae]|uniref:ABC transporter permease n=1 Tax=Sulfitobacter noctilucae TaxID=1342302 RepID=UPI0004690257|nr:ABC transporter permease [Sulfitobacter noctilucae]KIN70564.1 Binding-protein-dependent transport systems inner membrane component [Sulfitobacter noctilucae]
MRLSDWALWVFTIAFFIFMILPIAVVVVISFTSAGYASFPIPGWSLKWFARIFEYEPFMNSLWVSLKLGVIATAASCLLGVPAALYLSRSRSGWATAITAFMLSPLSMPMIVIGFASLFFLSRLGFGVSFLSLVIVHTVICLPYVIRTVTAVYRAIPPAYEEAAQILGASRLTVFREVTLPLIRPGIAAGSLFSFLTSFDNLPVSYFFGSAQTNTLPVVMLAYMEHQFDPSIAALSTLQLVFAVVALVVADRLYGIQKMTVAT